MISIEEHLDMIWTEGIDQGYNPYDKKGNGEDLPPIRFHLELLEDPETGELYFVE